MVVHPFFAFFLKYIDIIVRMIGRFIFSHAIRIVFSESLKTFSRLQNLRVLKIELSQHFFVPADVVKFITNQKKVNY